jgi:heme-degrading monooxygenase HmoA
MVVSLVRGTIEPERADDIVDRYAAAIGDGVPRSIIETHLLRGRAGEVAVLTLWRSRADLDAMIAGGEEPLARRLIREAGGTPVVEFFDVAASGIASGETARRASGAGDERP